MTATHQVVGATEEHELVDCFVEHMSDLRRELVVNYYVSLKAEPFAILVGPPDIDKMRLARGLCDVVSRRSDSHWREFGAHPWWATSTGSPAYFAAAHELFSEMKVSDALKQARAEERSGRPVFMGAAGISPAELVRYFDDLPRGLLWRGDGSATSVILPTNLYVTGTLDVADGNAGLMEAIGYCHATVIELGYDDLNSAQPGRESGHESGWEQTFAGSVIRDRDRAMAKLGAILGHDHAPPLAPIGELAKHIGLTRVSPSVLDHVWRYLANAYGPDGGGLFSDSRHENLWTAQDLSLAQIVLPHLLGPGASMPDRWEGALGHLALNYPRAFARAEAMCGRYFYTSSTTNMRLPAVTSGKICLIADPMVS